MRVYNNGMLVRLYACMCVLISRIQVVCLVYLLIFVTLLFALTI